VVDILLSISVIVFCLGCLAVGTGFLSEVLQKTEGYDEGSDWTWDK
jgi:hypothetical protein